MVSRAHTSSSACHPRNVRQPTSIPLPDYVATFAETNPAASVLTFDAHSWFNEVLDNAAAYGFTNITEYGSQTTTVRADYRSYVRCCTCTEPSYFSYNTGHPTEHVHRLLAAAIESSLENAST